MSKLIYTTRNAGRPQTMAIPASGLLVGSPGRRPPGFRGLPKLSIPGAGLEQAHFFVGRHATGYDAIRNLAAGGTRVRSRMGRRGVPTTGWTILSHGARIEAGTRSFLFEAEPVRAEPTRIDPEFTRTLTTTDVAREHLVVVEFQDAAQLRPLRRLSLLPGQELVVAENDTVPLALRRHPSVQRRHIAITNHDGRPAIEDLSGGHTLRLGRGGRPAQQLGVAELTESAHLCLGTCPIRLWVAVRQAHVGDHLYAPTLKEAQSA